MAEIQTAYNYYSPAAPAAWRFDEETVCGRAHHTHAAQQTIRRSAYLYRFSSVASMLSAGALGWCWCLESFLFLIHFFLLIPFYFDRCICVSRRLYIIYTHSLLFHSASIRATQTSTPRMYEYSRIWSRLRSLFAYSQSPSQVSLFLLQFFSCFFFLFSFFFGSCNYFSKQLSACWHSTSVEKRIKEGIIQKKKKQTRWE